MGCSRGIKSYLCSQSMGFYSMPDYADYLGHR